MLHLHRFCRDALFEARDRFDADSITFTFQAGAWKKAHHIRSLMNSCNALEGNPYPPVRVEQDMDDHPYLKLPIGFATLVANRWNASHNAFWRLAPEQDTGYQKLDTRRRTVHALKFLGKDSSMYERAYDQWHENGVAPDIVTLRRPGLLHPDDTDFCFAFQDEAAGRRFCQGMNQLIRQYAPEAAFASLRPMPRIVQNIQVTDWVHVAIDHESLHEVLTVLTQQPDSHACFGQFALGSAPDRVAHMGKAIARQ